MIADKLDEGGRVGFPVLRKAFEIFEDRMQPDIVEEADGVFGVLVEVGVEDALIHEVGLALYRNQEPAKVVKLERRQIVGRPCDGGFHLVGVLVECGFFARYDLCEDAEPVASRSSRKDGAVASLLELEVALFGDSHCGRMFPGVVCHVVLLEECDPYVDVRCMKMATRRVTGPRSRMYGTKAKVGATMSSSRTYTPRWVMS